MRLRLPQSRTQSLLEAGTNVLVGYLLALATQRVVYPWFGIDTTLAADGLIAAVFTAVSLVRSYLLRRAFESLGVVCGRWRSTAASRGT